jgi:ATP-dependent helicase YprA (DUF1998 family)
MPRHIEKDSEDRSHKKRSRRDDSESPKRDSDRRKHCDHIYHALDTKKRDEKREEKKTRKDEKSPSKVKNHDDKEDHVVTRRMSQHQAAEKEVDAEGQFENFPEIHPKTVEGLKKRGITHLFPVQYSSFRTIWDRKDLIVRDLTGSGKTLGFALPIVEYLRKHKLFGTGKIQAICLAPTRELALQVSKEFNHLKHSEHEYNVLTVYGGVSIDDQTY